MSDFQYNDRVLIIEDEIDLLSFITEALSSYGFTAIPCSTIEEAREQLELGPFSILVTDWMIGTEKVDSLIFDPKVANLLPPSILIITAYADSISFNNQLASKFYVLEKPFSLNKLPKILAEMSRASK